MSQGGHPQLDSFALGNASDLYSCEAAHACARDDLAYPTAANATAIEYTFSI